MTANMRFCNNAHIKVHQDVHFVNLIYKEFSGLFGSSAREDTQRPGFFNCLTAFAEFEFLVDVLQVSYYEPFGRESKVERLKVKRLPSTCSETVEGNQVELGRCHK